MYNASTEGVDLQYSIRCQLTKPADKLRYCIVRKDNVVEREMVDIFMYCHWLIPIQGCSGINKPKNIYLIGF